MNSQSIYQVGDRIVALNNGGYKFIEAGQSGTVIGLRTGAVDAIFDSPDSSLDVIMFDHEIMPEKEYWLNKFSECLK